MVAVNEKLRPGAEPKGLPVGNYYLLQDTLHRAVALTDSSGAVVEAYDCDAYGNTITFTAADSSGNWWGDSATQSSLGANDIIYCGYRLAPETENYYVRNRFYAPPLGRWLTRDPIGYQGGVNLYEYVGGDPAGNMDPAGMDVVVLLSPKEASKMGHTAVLIGNNRTGWDYYSKNGKTGGLFGGNEGRHEHYRSLRAFLNSKGHCKRYPERIEIPTTPCQDRAMEGYAKKHVYTPYRLWGSNCAALVQGALHAGNIPTGNIGYFWGWGPAYPKTLWGNLNKEMGNGQLPPETTAVVPAIPSSVWPMNPAMPLHVVGPLHLVVPFS